MPDNIFVDTNVLVYARDATEATKQTQAHAWLEHLWRTRTGRVSYQVLQEYYVTVTNKLSPGLSPQAARSDVLALCAWQPVEVDRPAMEGAWQIQDRFGFSWWDSLIVSAAKIAECRYLLSEDLQPDQMLDQVTVVSPFHATPGDIENR
jgi:predicted nucleic acid-binding protein